MVETILEPETLELPTVIVRSIRESDLDGITLIDAVSSRRKRPQYFRMIFEMGYYHADPHAGNIFALSGGRIAFVDFGRTATVSRRNRDAVFDMLLAVFDDDPRAATEAVLAAPSPSLDRLLTQVTAG